MKKTEYELEILRKVVSNDREFNLETFRAHAKELDNLRKEIKSLSEKISFYKKFSNYVYGATNFKQRLYMQIRCNSGHSFKIANVENIDFDTDAFYVHYFDNGELNFNKFPLDSYRIVNISF